MGYELTYASICAQVNASLDVKSLLEYVQWFPEKVVRSGDVYHALCPIHEEKVFRTLTLNPRNNTYHCKHVNCPGNHPADFLDLIGKVTHRPLAEVILELVRHFGPDRFRLSPRQMRVLEELTSNQQEPDALAQGGEK